MLEITPWWQGYITGIIVMAIIHIIRTTLKELQQ